MSSFISWVVKLPEKRQNEMCREGEDKIIRRFECLSLNGGAKKIVKQVF